MYSLGFNNLSDSPVIVLSPHQHQYDPITRAAHSWYHPHENKKPNMSDHQRAWDDTQRNRHKLAAIKPSEKKKRREMEASGVNPTSLGPSIPQAGTPSGSPPDRTSGDEARSDTRNLVNQASKSLENLVAAIPTPNSEEVTAQQYTNERDFVEDETNHRRKVSRQSSHHSSASDHSRSLFTMTPLNPSTSQTSFADLADASLQKEPAIDAWSAKISMSWSEPQDDADHRSNVMILTHDWKMNNAYIRAVNKNLGQCLVELSTGWFLFSNGMKTGQAVAPAKEEAIAILRAAKPVFPSEAVQLPPHNEISPGTNPALNLESSMPGETDQTGNKSCFSSDSSDMMENIRPSVTDSNGQAVQDDGSNRMDID